MARRGGWRRLGRKRFRYVDGRGRELEDEEQLARIASLAIPPAWTEVWISANPGARLQATGTDAAGRKQYLYHPSFRAAQERAKFERLLDFASSLPGYRRRAEEHLRRGAYEHEWACAVATAVINKAWFRVGSDRHARRSRTYGVTTLRKQHVTVRGDEIAFCFRTKNRKLVRRSVRNERLAQAVGALLELPNGSRLFRYEDDGELVDLTAPALNSYLGEHLGDGFTRRTSVPGAAPCSPPWSLHGVGRQRRRRRRRGHWQVSCAKWETSSGTPLPSPATRMSARSWSSGSSRAGRLRTSVRTEPGRHG